MNSGREDEEERDRTGAKEKQKRVKEVVLKRPTEGGAVCVCVCVFVSEYNLNESCIFRD